MPERAAGQQFVQPGMVQLSILHRPGCGCDLDTPDPDDTTVQLGCVIGYLVTLPAEPYPFGGPCICDPDDLFDPPDPTPRAVAGCTAHPIRRAAQLYAERNRLA